VIRRLPLVALAAALLAAWTPLLVPHAVSGASAMIDWVRGEAIHAAVEHGDWIPTWLPDLYERRGSPLPSFYGPFSYLVAELLRLVSGSPGAAWKLAHVLFWIVGAGGAAAFARGAFGKGAAVASAAAFALSPYLLVDAYVNVGLAEFAALALVPWAFAALCSGGTRWAIGGALVVALLPLTHNLTALQAVPALLAFAWLEGGAARRRGLVVIGSGLALSLFFWLPVLVEKRLLWADESLTGGFFEAARHLVRPLDLLPGRASARLTVGPSESVPLRIGELFWGALLALPLVGLRRRPVVERRRAWALAIGGVGALLLSTRLAAPLWEQLPLVSFFQFPFRLFLVATVLLAPLVGLFVASRRAGHRSWFAAGVVVLALLVARPYLSVRYLFLDRSGEQLHPVPSERIDQAARNGWLEPEQVVTLERLRSSPWNGSSGHEYLPRTVRKIPTETPAAAATALGDGIEVLSSEWGYPEVTAEVRVERPGDVRLEQFALRGWRVEVDGVGREWRVEPEHGRIVVPLAPGDRRVVARFGLSTLRRACAALSAAFAVAAAWFTLRRRAFSPGGG